MTALIYVFLAGLGMILSAGTACAQQVLYVAGYGGSFELGMRQDTIPEFEKKHNVKVEYVAGNSTDTLAKLQAQKGNQRIDVILVDDGPMYRAISLGFCAPIKNLSALDLHEAARFKEDKAVGVGLAATGLMYNTRYFQEKGWTPPTSWNDLTNPKYKNLLIIPPINNTYGIHALSMFARLNGGGESNVEPGFKVMKEKVNFNVLVYEPSPGKITELFQSGQAAIAVWGSGRVASFAATGFPVDFVYPKEGAVTLLITTCPVVKPNMSLLAQEFIETLLAPKFQKEFSETYGYGPVNKQVAVDAAKLGMAPVGERATKLVSVNWDAINDNIDLWTKRWNREVER